MKLKTIPAFFNQSLTLESGKSIKFDSIGSCDVSENAGVELLGKYPEFVFNENHTKKQEVSIEEEINGELVIRLRGEILGLKETIGIVKTEKENVEKDLVVWKDEVQKFKDRAEKAEEELKDHKKIYDEQAQAFELKLSLITSTTDQLRKLCESSGYKKEEWDKLSKEKLIEYIQSKV